MIVENYFHISLVKQKQSHNFLNQSDWSKTETNCEQVTCWHTVSRAWRKLHVLTSSSYWFIVLFVFIGIGRSNNFGFGFRAVFKWVS